MRIIRQHIFFRIFSLLIACVLLVPSAVKISHFFEGHEHEICVDKSVTHLHTLDLDCEFYKFKAGDLFTFEFESFHVSHIENNHQDNHSLYQYLNQFQGLHIQLRAPPYNS